MYIDDDTEQQVERANNERFIGRWSRRKRAAARRTSAIAAPPEKSEARQPAKTDSDMPAIAMLGANSDLSDFFSPGVSETLRRQALRKVFLQPKYNLTDGLDDYAEDYTRFPPLGDLVTAGLRAHRERIASHIRSAGDAEAGATRAEEPGAEIADDSSGVIA
jgi:hypothetical protein